MPNDRLHRALIAALGRSTFANVTTDDIGAVRACGDTIVYRPGDTVFNQGDPSEYCHLVVRGIVELFRRKERDRLLSRVRSGRFVGDIALFLDVPYLSSARAATYAEIHWFERTRLLAVMRERPAVALGWLTSAMATLADTHQHLEMVLGRTARQQVAGALIGNMDDRGRVEISQSALGALLGVGRQTINRALAELADLGMVRTGYRSIDVLDPVALADLFDGVDLPTH